MNRITLDTSFENGIVAMCEGNPGAVNVCMRLLGKPESGNNSLEFAEGWMNICRLDDMEIYGSDIWICYKDICQCDIDVLKKQIEDHKIKKLLENYFVKAK